MFSEILYDFLTGLNIIGFFSSIFILILLIHIFNDFCINYRHAFANILLPINIVINTIFAPIYYTLNFTKQFAIS